MKRPAAVRWLAAFVALAAWAGEARADEGGAPAKDEAGKADAGKADAGKKTKADEEGADDDSKGPTAARLKALEEQNAKLTEDLDQLRDDLTFLEQQTKQRAATGVKLEGYVDVGFFYVGGNGSGIRPDTGYQVLPQYRGKVPDTWLFMGDPLSTAVNARGEPADTGESRAVTFNPIGNKGKASFLLNALNVSLLAAPMAGITVFGMVDFVPRSRNVSDPNGKFLGDFVDVKLGYVEYQPSLTKVGVSLYAGKFDSVLGREYRSQESPDRLSVTPSLICRYTCGRPVGIKGRVRFLNEALVVNLSVTNGSHFVEMFPFANEADTNHMKTGAGRLSYRFDVGKGIEIGASGAYGAQDFQTDDRVVQWHYGADLFADWHDFVLSAEFVQGKASGKTEPGAVACNAAPCLRYKGAYGQLGYRVNNWLIPYTRVDWRDATHESGASFAYVSRVLRATFGARLELGTHVIVKAEYTVNRELAPLPQFPDDVFTSALVTKF